mmetsp:Transcript_8180/g.17298  ORF Transcript_8180/g.17298 Transcript_8180/m.17298 type:complete len:86 (-) Transcript_8180:129-386(-)
MILVFPSEKVLLWMRLTTRKNLIGTSTRMRSLKVLLTVRVEKARKTEIVDLPQLEKLSMEYISIIKIFSLLYHAFRRFELIDKAA